MKKWGPIIVVDDDLDDQFLYQKTLERFNLTNAVVFFSNGMDAYQYLADEKTDPFIILCDINMPLMNGIELRQMMCENGLTCKKNAPFIFMSTSVRNEDLNKAASLCTQGFFQKEVSIDKQEKVLRSIIDYWTSCKYGEQVESV